MISSLQTLSMSNAENPKPSIPRTAVLACAGTGINGELGDRLARRMQKEGLTEMYNIAQLRAKIASSSRLAMTPKVLVIDGCHSGCASECLKEMGYSGFDVWDIREHLDLDDRDYTEEDLEEALVLVKKRLGV
jgi:uncharacterized metal-binding protein